MANKWFWLILGTLIGWLVGWLIEVFYWRWKRRQRYEARIRELEDSLNACHAQVTKLRDEIRQRDSTISAPECPPAAKAEMRAVNPPTPRVEAAASMPIPAQDLTAIHGIGPAFEQKLYEAGIGTYAQLAALSDTEIEAIIQPQPWQKFDYESWNEEARRLAEETGTTNAVWNGIIPDDLTKIKGIGEVFEQKLYEAGIMTFADLAAKTAEELEAIIQPGVGGVNFEDWIAQARAWAQKEKE